MLVTDAWSLCSYIKGLLGGPTPAEYDVLKQENEELKQQLDDTKKQLEELQVGWHSAHSIISIQHVDQVEQPSGAELHLVIMQNRPAETVETDDIS